MKPRAGGGNRPHCLRVAAFRLVPAPARGFFMSKRRIGILTGGGDVPGLNAVIKSVTYRGSEDDFEVIGFRRGWEGLTHVNLADPESRAHYVIPLDRANTRTIDRRGGTVLHSSRTNPAKMRKLPPHLAGKEFPASGNGKGGAIANTWDVSNQVIANLSGLGIEHLIAIGGDDTLSYAAKLDALGVKVLAVPKTMDNDVRNTEYCIGFSTAITRASDAIQRQRTTVGSHERIGIFRVFGRDAGFTALYTAYVSSIRCVIPEYSRTNNMPIYDKTRGAFRSVPKYKRKGWLDICLIKDGRVYGIEVKNDTGRLSPEQEQLGKEIGVMAAPMCWRAAFMMCRGRVCKTEKVRLPTAVGVG